MELNEVVSRRRMVRRFDPSRPVPDQVVRDLVALAQRAPSAGFTQGWDAVALTTPEQRARFWEVASPHPSDSAEQRPNPWLRGVSAAPVLLLLCANPTAYLDRYAEPDKGWTDRALQRWPIPYWDTDTAMAAMLILLGATDRGLGALFFGVPGERHDAVKAAYAVPADRRLVGVVALGHEAERVTSPSLARGRRPLQEVLHLGSFGAPAAEVPKP